MFNFIKDFIMSALQWLFSTLLLLLPPIIYITKYIAPKITGKHFLGNSPSRHDNDELTNNEKPVVPASNPNMNMPSAPSATDLPEPVPSTPTARKQHKRFGLPNPKLAVAMPLNGKADLPEVVAVAYAVPVDRVPSAPTYGCNSYRPPNLDVNPKTPEAQTMTTHKSCTSSRYTPMFDMAAQAVATVAALTL